jgi:hypothetical protein
MKIAILMEGETERVFLPYLRQAISTRLPDKMPRLIASKYDGRIPKQEKLKRVVDALFRGRDPDADHVVALTDVYTGSNDFQNAADAKQKMRSWVGRNDRFHAHVAQHDFEAWLLPYWAAIQELARHYRTAPAGAPESVNQTHPPSYHIRAIFRTGQGPRHYTKTRDAKRILQGKNLNVAAAACPELKAFSKQNSETMRWRSHLDRWSKTRFGPRFLDRSGLDRQPAVSRGLLSRVSRVIGVSATYAVAAVNPNRTANPKYSLSRLAAFQNLRDHSFGHRSITSFLSV